jgi:transcriptional regulator GlxA family with amidase domain
MNDFTASLESLSAASHASIVHQALQVDRSALARVRAIARAIAHDPSRDYSGERLAERAAMSLRNLQRLFARATGLTPSRFVERERVRLAERFLRETSLPLKTVALRSGFGNEERMRRAFHRVVGRCPREHAAAGTGYAAATVPPMR